jgi:hypothetical protein
LPTALLVNTMAKQNKAGASNGRKSISSLSRTTRR